MSFMEKLLDGADMQWKTIGEVFDLKNGYTPSKSNKEYWENGTVPWFRMEDIRENGRIRGSAIQNISMTAVKGNLVSENANKNGGMGIIGLSKLKQFKIPIPCPENPEKSLRIQAEIVRILDAFTAMTAELSARKKQYNHYRDQLLSFEPAVIPREVAESRSVNGPCDFAQGDTAVEWKTLGDACSYVDYRGKTPTKTQSGIFLVTAKNIRLGYIDYGVSQEYISKDDYGIVMRRGIPKKGDVLITTEAPCGFVAQVDREDIALAQRVIKYRSKDNRLSNSFLKHYLLGSHFQDKLMRAATGSTVQGIKGSKLHQLTIPIPPLAEQARIVAILDKFDALTNSLSEGLPREIELRQKQYEYYRDRLLSFPKPKEVQAERQ